jgi:hypothetical protein
MGAAHTAPAALGNGRRIIGKAAKWMVEAGKLLCRLNFHPHDLPPMNERY